MGKPSYQCAGGPLALTEICTLINTALSEAGLRPIPSVTDRDPDQGSLMRIIMACLDDAKAEDTTVIGLQGKTSIADSMIIASGRSNVHVNAIADRILRALKQAHQTSRVEGLSNGDWVLIDAGDIIVHLFRPEVRLFYNLEKMWGADRPLTA